MAPPPAQQLSLFEDAGWPPLERFPTNTRFAQVRTPVLTDLQTSRQPLIVTGYTSLNIILDFLVTGMAGGSPVETLRLVLGHEPTLAVRPTYRLRDQPFDQIVADYWLERGISLYQSAKLLVALELLRSGRITVRLSADPNRPIHAKIYRGDHAVTIGSSNFSHAGLDYQIEANVRFTDAATDIESHRFREGCQLAERIWELGQDYTAGFIDLLQRLLHSVTWPEALARACAEVLEGTWATRYLTAFPVGDAPPLWPSQAQGIAQAMWVLEQVGSVLVADATGSGKTRLGAHLIRSAIQRTWRSGRMRQDMPVLVCPAGVQEEWEMATTDCGQAVKIFSDGILSSTRSEKHAALLRALRQAQVLAIDEGHRFVNRQAQRTQHLLHNMADYVLLFTATPINKGVRDLLALIDLLGADNFDTDVLAILEHILSRRGSLEETMSTSERTVLQQAIARFTVRRTKTQLNNLITAAPDYYRDGQGRRCCYPKHEAHYYTCGETEVDRALAAEIDTATQELRGLINLRSLYLSDALRRDGVAEEGFLHGRLQGAQGLARYQVRAALRSSRAALIEHLRGTAAACQSFGLPRVKAQETGAILARLDVIAGQLPETNLAATLPPWLTDPEEHAQACAAERAIYERIAECAMQISDAREETKAAHLVALLDRYPILLAFDGFLITLTALKQRLDALHQSETILATGADARGRQRVRTLAQLGSTATRVIALCSDAMAEGFNLQAASAVVHLDMPSVIRQAEQRSGRVDRLNSPHAVIASYWPQDSPEFALRSDERFYARHRLVAELLGSNVPLPGTGSVVTAEQAMTEITEAVPDGPRWDEITDAFAPVRELVEATSPLVPRVIYNQIRNATARLVTSVSAVSAYQPWAFFAVQGTEWGAPRWVWMASPTDDPITDLDAISQRLQQQLSVAEQREYDTTATAWQTRFLDRLRATEVLLLPRKKQRVLEEMERVLKHYRTETLRTRDHTRQAVIDDLMALLARPADEWAVDLSTLAECWLDLIRPLWYDRLKQPRRGFRPLLLKQIRKDLYARPLETEALRAVLARDLWVRPLDERIIAAIIGVPSAQQVIGQDTS
jgi:hypothetical protein